MNKEWTIKEYNKKIYVFDEYMKLSDNQKDLKDLACELVISYSIKYSYLLPPLKQVIKYYNENIKNKLK